MSEQAPNRRGQRVSPGPFLAGVVLAFLACCAAGRVAASRNWFREFTRFHAYISPQALFFPTASEVRALGRARLERDRIAVVVGGNSILFGHLQGPEDLWTERLQEQLGDDFRVINLALPSARPAEFGGLAAEILEHDHPRLLYLSDCGPAGVDLYPDGANLPYFFWDAYYKGMVQRDPVRQAALARRRAAERVGKDGLAYAEMQRAARIDASLRFQDLWTAVTYRYAATVWTPLTSAGFPRPRRTYAEGPLLQPSLEQRYPPALDEASMQVLRNWLREGARYWTGGSAEDCVLARTLRECFPEECRRRTLMLVIRDSPHYVAQLSAEEAAAYSDVFANFVRVLQANGMSALDVGGDYGELDYVDRCHLGAQGGQRLAAQVAPHLRRLAERLGYLPEGGR